MRLVRLEELASDGVLVLNDGYRTKQPELGDSGFPILRVAQIVDGRAEMPRDPDFVREEFRRKIGEKLAHSGDVVLCTKGTVGRRARIENSSPPFVYSPQVCFFRVLDDDVLNRDFLYYWLDSPEFGEQAAGLKAQTDMADYISLRDLRRVKMSLPEIATQREIGRTLRLLDDKIELNRRMNETLEGIARAIFKSWFMDFDPVHAKMARRQPPGMSAETAALFPEQLVTSDLGPIPSEWTVTPVGEAVRVVGGSTPSTKEPAYWGGPHFFATPKDLSELDSILLLSTERTITDGGVERISSGILPRGTVLLSSRAPIGYVAIARMPVSINQGFIAMVCDRDLPTSYVALWVNSNVEVFKQNAGGTTFAEISKAVFRPLPILVPPRTILERFTNCVDPLFDRIEANLRESESLSEIRDALLPRLVSGEVRVKEAS